MFGRLASSLHPDEARPHERVALRALILDSEHETRAELAAHLMRVDGELYEAQVLEAVRPLCSAALGAIVDAVVAYERFAALVDAGFRTLCAVSYSMGAQPLTPRHVERHKTIVRCTRALPEHYRRAVSRMAAIGADSGLEERLGAFAIARPPGELVALMLEHHERIQSTKPPNGKRSWFEPLRHGWVVRGPYGSIEQPELSPWFVHPVRVAALRQFLADTAP